MELRYVSCQCRNKFSKNTDTPLIFKTDSEYSEEKDNIYKLKEIDIVIDKKSLPFIKDSELDYKNELVGSSFSISNPNAKNSCGCGSSFSI